MSSWTIKTEKNGTKVRAFCPIAGCKAYREHAERNLAVKYVTGHLVAMHADDGVRASDSFSAK